jgi:hypothetical protein
LAADFDIILPELDKSDQTTRDHRLAIQAHAHNSEKLLLASGTVG